MSNEIYQEVPLKQPMGTTTNAAPQPDPMLGQTRPTNQNTGPGNIHVTDLASLMATRGIIYTSLTSTGVAQDAAKTFKELAVRSAAGGNSLVPQFLPIEDSQKSISVVVAYVPFSTGNTCYYLVYLLEKTMIPVIDKARPLGNTGRSIEIDYPASKYFDTDMKLFVEELLQRHLQSNGLSMTLHWGGRVVVNNNIDIVNTDDMAPFYYHGLSVLQMCIDCKNNLPTTGLTSDILKNPNYQVVARYDIKPGMTYLSTTKQPIASDFTINTVAVLANRSRALSVIHNNSGELMLTSICGYVDFRRRPQNFMQSNQGFVTGYNPVIVIDHCSTLGKSPLNIDSLLTMLLALPTILPLVGEDMRWTTIFEPNPGFTGKTTIGALGLEHNPEPRSPQPFQPKILEILPQQGMYDPNKMTAASMARIYVDPTPIVAFDILQGGPLERIHAILAKAMPGTEEEALIIHELDAFSGGVFSTIWKPTMRMLASRDGEEPTTIIHAATFEDDNHGLHDHRSVDYLSVLAKCKGDAAVIDQFAYGYLPGTGNDEMLDMKRKMLKHMFPTLKITGLITRVFIHNDLINAINIMLSMLKINYSVEGLQDVMNTGMYNHAYRTDQLVPIQNTNTFTINTGPSPMGGGLYDPGFSSFRR